MRAALFILLVVAVNVAEAGEWPNWRGPTFDGASTETPLPERLDDTTQRWMQPLPGVGDATPAVWGERVFVTAIDRETSLFVALALRRTDGQVLWKNEIGIAFNPSHRDDLAAPSPVVDGERVVVLFGSGDLAAFTHDGMRLWQRNLQKDHGKFTNQWVYGSSPLLLDGRLYVQVLQTSPDAVAGTPRTGSYVLGIDAATGKDLWKHPRPCPGRGESQDSYTTPIPFTHGADRSILLLGGDCLTGHHPLTGVEQWRFAGWNTTKAKDWRMITTPVVADGRIILCTARGRRVLALMPDGAGGMRESWSSDVLSSDVAAPLVYRGNLYVLNGDERELACFNPADGALRWRGKFTTTGVIRASPTAGDGRLYAVSETGEVVVFGVDPFQVLSTTTLPSDGPGRASIALAHGQVFVRTASALHAFVRP